MKTVKWIGKAMGAGIVAILALSAFCLIYGFSDAHIANSSGATDYKWLPRALRTTMEEGFSWLRMDANGFNNQWSPAGDTTSVLLMGSSHEEAVNVGATESTAYALNALLQPSDAYCYSIAMSGHTICHNVRNLASAIEEYDPTEWVVIETSTVLPAESQMASVLDGSFPVIPSYDSGILFYLQKIPALKAMYKSLEGLVLTDSAPAEEDANGLQPTISDTYGAVLEAFLRKAKTDAGEVKLMIVYHPRMAIHADGSISPLIDPSSADAFSRACSDAGIAFIDMTDSFVAHYSETCALPHGFPNTHAGSGHLNPAGHQLIAEAIYRTLTAQEAIP